MANRAFQIILLSVLTSAAVQQHWLLNNEIQRRQDSLDGISELKFSQKSIGKEDKIGK